MDLKSLNLCCHLAFTLIVYCSYSCTTSVKNSPTMNISKTVKSEVKVVLRNKAVQTHDNVELLCEIEPKGAALDTVWIRGSELIHESDRIKFGKNRIYINHAMESDAGYYTCSVRTAFGIQNGTALITVESEEDDDDGSEEFEEPHPCGKPKKELFSTCSYSYGFPNCKSFAPPVNADDVQITKTFVNSSPKPSYKIDVQWKIPKAGNSDIWGWMIFKIDLHLYPGDYECIQINKKFTGRINNGEPYVKYSFDNASLGTILKFKIQSLPSIDMDHTVEKKISTKDRCQDFAEPDCCYEAKNIVLKQKDETSAMLSWPDLKNSSINSNVVSSFKVKYYSTYLRETCHEESFETAIEDVLNKSHIMVHNLRSFCKNYSFQVTPIFRNNKCYGKASKLYSFTMTTMRKSGNHPTNNLKSNLLKAVVVVVAVLIVIIFASAITIILKKKQAVKKINETDTNPKERPVTEVFIAHASHCKDCEDAVISLATYLNMTGHCKCSLDLCSLPNEWSPGMTQYYENQIAKCQKVIVVFTVNESWECIDNIKARNFDFQKNLIRSELLANCPTTKFIPVYMDFLSDRDIPSFLRNKKFFSLSSQLTELFMYIIDEPVCKPVFACPMLTLDEDRNLLRQKKILDQKIKELNVKHLKMLKTKNNNMLAKLV